MLQLYSINDKSTTLTSVDKEELHKWSDKLIKKNLDYYTHLHGYRNILDTRAITIISPIQFNIGISSSNNNIFLDNNNLIWYAFVTSNLLTQNQNEEEKFSNSLIQFYSLMPYIYKVYLTKKKGYFQIDVISDKNYLSNKDFEVLIEEEIELSNTFLDFDLYFNYFNNKDFQANSESLLIYQNNGTT